MGGWSAVFDADSASLTGKTGVSIWKTGVSIWKTGVSIWKTGVSIWKTGVSISGKLGSCRWATGTAVNGWSTATNREKSAAEKASVGVRVVMGKIEVGEAVVGMLEKNDSAAVG
jgi:hypothetical protein